MYIIRVLDRGCESQRYAVGAIDGVLFEVIMETNDIDNAIKLTNCLNGGEKLDAKMRLQLIGCHNRMIEEAKSKQEFHGKETEQPCY